MKKILSTLGIFLVSFILYACHDNSIDDTKTSEKNEEDIRVLLYNIHFGVGGDGIFNIDRIKDVLENAEADIIILNEVDKFYSDRSNNMDMAKYLADELGMNHLFRASIIIENSPNPEREVGNAILTKSTIEHLGTRFFSEGDQWPRVITKSKIKLQNGQIVNVAVSHFGLTESGRIKQANETLEFLADVDNEPVIFAGDLNATPESVPLEIISNKYNDAFSTRNSFYTFPANNPTKRIDYIFGNEKIIFKNNAHTILTQASDHLPIVVDFTIKKSNK
ncbi:endonuclease/exonuclease/phosphatase family protein [Dysgonomonadaceae bacterium zrk40]|nr:endonuclease/exonuclease/phosphatase family protein [Dysgonomonadaceae bacterium zrk40]